MAVLIIGDSFCADADGWPGYLAELLDDKLECRGVKGTSSYHVYQQLSRTLIKYYRTIVLVISSHDRICCGDYTTLNILRKTYAPHDPPELADAAHAFYQYLYDDDYFKVLQLSLLNQIIKMTEDHPQCLILRAFPENELLEKIVPSNIPLLDIHYREISNLSSLTTDQVYEIDDRFFLNHMSPSNNKLMAHYVHDLLVKGNSEIALQDFKPLELTPALDILHKKTSQEDI